MRQKIIIAVISFLAGLLVYDVFLVDLYVAKKINEVDETERICPTRSSFTAVWDEWSNQFFAENPDVGSEAQLQEWNSLMVGIGCPEWVDPFRDVVATSTYTNANGSTSVIYQYKLPE